MSAVTCPERTYSIECVDTPSTCTTKCACVSSRNCVNGLIRAQLNSIMDGEIPAPESIDGMEILLEAFEVFKEKLLELLTEWDNEILSGNPVSQERLFDLSDKFADLGAHSYVLSVTDEIDKLPIQGMEALAVSLQTTLLRQKAYSALGEVALANESSRQLQQLQRLSDSIA